MQQASFLPIFSLFQCDICTLEEFLDYTTIDGEIDEVDLGIVRSSAGGGPGTHYYTGYFGLINNAASGTGGNGSNSWTSGGSGNPSGLSSQAINRAAAAILSFPPDENGECPEGFEKNDEDACVKIQEPCEDIKTQINATAFKAKIDELKKVTNKKQETGYAQDKNGTFTKLNPIKNGHSLDMGGISSRSLNGFIHTHLNNFPTGSYDNNGRPKEYQIYRMFSPADVIAFLKIAKLSDNIRYVYATVITSSGNYTLKFTGNKSDIKGLKKPAAYKEDYIEYMDKYKSSKERGFLHFLKDHIKVKGIELYKLHKPLFSSTIKIQQKTLDTRGKVDKIECE